MEYYDEISRGYNELYGEEQKKKARKAQELLNILPEETVLDVGCGTGIATEQLQGKKTGIDPSLSLIKQAAFPVVHGRAEQMPFKDKSFDVVVCMTAIHHCDVSRALVEIKRVARKRIAIGVLKNAKHFGSIAASIRAVFSNAKEVEAENDVMFIANL